MNRRTHYWVVAGLNVLWACGGHVDVGSNQHKGGQTGTEGPNKPFGGTPNEPSGGKNACDDIQKPSAYQGGSYVNLGFGGAHQWTGFAGNQTSERVSAPPPAQACTEQTLMVWEGDTLDDFFQPLQRWRLSVTGTSPDGKLCGTFAFVDQGQAAPATATDPEFAYPSGNPHADPYPIPGFEYPIVKGATFQTEMRLRIERGEPFREWCALQQVHADGTNSCYLPGQGWAARSECCIYYDSEFQSRIANGTQCYYCVKVCECDGERCVNRSAFSELLLEETAETLSGTLDGVRIQLKRVE